MTAQNVIPSSDTLEMQDTVLLKRENFNAAYPTRVDLVKDSPVVKALDSLAYLRFFSENGLYGTVDFNYGIYYWRNWTLSKRKSIVKINGSI